MSHNNQINVSVDGNIIDVTNNVQFIINSDIYGGEFFETQDSIKINAPAYFSSCGKLITKDDYTSYFRGLTSPITVQNALVYGQQEVQQKLPQTVVHKLIQNNIFYSILGHLYKKNNGNWAPVNLLTGQDENNNAVTIYGDKYLDHICDFIKMLYSYEGYYNKIFKSEADEQWIKNVRLIYDNCKHKIEVNSILLPMVPFVQYFDAVGTVYVDPLTDIEAYTKEMQNKVYEYLDQKLASDRRIYKSEIIDLYNKNDRTKAVDIDFKISSVIKSPATEFKWNDLYNSDFRIMQDTSLNSYLSALSTYQTDQAIKDKYGNGWWNSIQVSKVDQNGNSINEAIFRERKVTFRIKFVDTSHVQTSPAITVNEQIYEIVCETASDDKYIYLYPLTVQAEGTGASYRNFGSDAVNLGGNSDAEIRNATEDGVIELRLITKTDEDYESTSNLSMDNMADYKTANLGIIIADIKAWLKDLQEIKSADRAIDLPYKIDILFKSFENTEFTIRDETILRRGSLNTPQSKSISEDSFWNYVVPYLILPWYKTAEAGREVIDESTDYDSQEWEAATKLIMDVYPLIKPGICDSILDDNNNIVNFSTDMELPVLFNKINVKYKMN